MEKIDLTVMCMVYDDLGNVLVQDRIKNWKGIAFPGGHVKKGEPISAAIIREIKEETGLAIKNLEFCGIKNYFDWKLDYRYNVYLFKTNQYEGKLTSECPEGKNFWMPKSELLSSKLSNTFDITLKHIYFGNQAEVYYTNKNGEWEMLVY